MRLVIFKVADLYVLGFLCMVFLWSSSYLPSGHLPLSVACILMTTLLEDTEVLWPWLAWGAHWVADACPGSRRPYCPAWDQCPAWTLTWPEKAQPVCSSHVLPSRPRGPARDGSLSEPEEGLCALLWGTHRKSLGIVRCISSLHRTPALPGLHLPSLVCLVGFAVAVPKWLPALRPRLVCPGLLWRKGQHLPAHSQDSGLSL